MLDTLLNRLLGVVVVQSVAGSMLSVCFLFLAALLFIPLEHLLDVPRAPRPNARRRRGERIADVLHACINPTLAGLVAVLLGLALTPSKLDRLLTALLQEDRTMVSVQWLRWTQSFSDHLHDDLHLPLAMLLSAFFGYWLHRALHTWPPLWRLHAVHHCSERVDWLSAHRQHPVEVALIVVTTVLPSALLGLSPKTIAAVFVFQKLHLFFSHTRTRLPVGPLRWLVVTPRHHHWHHELDARCNYAGLFPFLDFIFGTWRGEAHFPARTGTHTHVHRGFFRHLLHPFRRQSAVERDACQCRVAADRPHYGLGSLELTSQVNPR